MKPGDQLYVRKEETFPVSLKYIDVTRSTHTDLDVMQEKRIDDYWNVRFEQKFVRFLQRIHTLLKEKPPKEYMWSVGRLTKIQTTTIPDHALPEVWTKIGKAAQNREKQEWKNEKSKLDNARRPRGNLLIRTTRNTRDEE